MNRLALWVSAPGLVFALAAGAASRKHDATKLTCEEFPKASVWERIRGKLH